MEQNNPPFQEKINFQMRTFIFLYYKSLFLNYQIQDSSFIIKKNKTMRIKTSYYLFFLLCCTFTLTNCGETESKEATTTIETPSEPHPSRKVVEVNYQSATVKPSQTNYYFQKGSGIRVEVGINNQKDVEKAKIPNGMLGEGEDGAVIANPDKVGKPFELVYEKGQVIEIVEK